MSRDPRKELMREALSAVAWSLRQLSEKSPVSSSMLSQYLKGSSVPSPENMFALGELLSERGSELKRLGRELRRQARRNGYKREAEAGADASAPLRTTRSASAHDSGGAEAHGASHSAKSEQERAPHAYDAREHVVEESGHSTAGENTSRHAKQDEGPSASHSAKWVGDATASAAAIMDYPPASARAEVGAVTEVAFAEAPADVVQEDETSRGAKSEVQVFGVIGTSHGAKLESEVEAPAKAEAKVVDTSHGAKWATNAEASHSAKEDDDAAVLRRIQEEMDQRLDEQEYDWRDQLLAEDL